MADNGADDQRWPKAPFTQNGISGVPSLMMFGSIWLRRVQSYVAWVRTNHMQVSTSHQTEILRSLMFDLLNRLASRYIKVETKNPVSVVFHSKEISSISVRLSDRSKVTQNKINVVKNCPQWSLNPQPLDHHSNALPTELSHYLVVCVNH